MSKYAITVTKQEVDAKAREMIMTTHREIALTLVSLEKKVEFLENKLGKTKDHCLECGTTEWLCGHNQRG